MTDAQTLLDKIAQCRPSIIEAQRSLVALPALGPDNGGAGEWEKARLVEGWCRDLCMDILHMDAPDDRVPEGTRPNFVATLAGGDGPAVWVLSHLDVVPPGSRELWTGDPWVLRVEGDRIYGRGVQDNHTAIIASFFAVKALAELGITPPGPVRLVMVSDEETGSGKGLDHVVGARPDLFDPRDLIIVPDAGNEEGSLVEVAEKSIFWLRVEVTGKQAHASTPNHGVNALFAAARMMVAVRDMSQRFPQTDPLFRLPSTFEPTAKEAGVENINTIPGRDVFYVDCRVLPGIDLARVEEAFREVFGAIAREEGVTVSISAVQRLQAPPGTPPDSPVVEALMRAIRQVKGLEPMAGGIGGGTVAAFFRQAGLPAAVWSTCPPTAHMPDEWVTLSGQIQDAQILGLIMAGLI